MNISVITLTHNKLPVTKRCLPSLLGTEHKSWELVVVDNGSSDGTVDWLRDFRDSANVPVTLIQNSDNIGCSTARNQGIDMARGGQLVFVDNDVALRSRHWLTRMCSELERDPKIAAVCPKLVYPLPPHNIQCAGAAVSPQGRVEFMGRGETRDDERFNNAREIQCLISACCMFRKSVLDEVGGFDEAFHPVEFEDIDLCYRARSAGYKITYIPTIEMYHFESVTTAGTPTVPNTALIIKHGMLFKTRWHHMFEKENGPPHKETAWKQLPPTDLDKVGDLPVVD